VERIHPAYLQCCLFRSKHTAHIYCWWWKGVHHVCLLYRWWKGYTLHVHTARGVDGNSLQVCTTNNSKRTPCKSKLLAVKSHTSCTSLLIVVVGVHPSCWHCWLWTGIYPVHPYMAYDGAKLALRCWKIKSAHWNAEKKLVWHRHFYC
jgi:hypothetical protein